MTEPYQSREQIPIFIGSTFEDLQEYRMAVREALHRLKTIVHGMEYFGSKPRSPKVECLNAVQSCKVYIGIFAMRYGSIDEETGKSMTHLEYEEASQIGLPMLIYLLDEEKQPVLPKYVDTGQSAKLLQELKNELKKKYTVSFFTTPDDLSRRVSQDLPPVLELIRVSKKKYPFVDGKHNIEVEHDGKTYCITIEKREILFDNQQKKQMWIQPFRHLISGIPIGFEKHGDVIRSVKNCIRKVKFRNQLEDLINSGIITIKGNEIECSIRNQKRD